MNTKVTALLVGLMMGTLGTRAQAHCEIPCGIYNDEVRANLIEEHAGTIEKSMKSIIALQKAAKPDYNQLVRWITNKDDHANKIQHIVTQYFMTQRIKTSDVRYADKIKALHEMLIYAMKCKQTTDVANVTHLRKALDTFRNLYFVSHSRPTNPPKTKKKRSVKQ